jgi:predicted AlkP superfamily phosphohydrolase/phosphomutase
MVKIVLIGLDGVSWNILDTMIEKNITPNIKKLKEKGSWGSLMSTIPAITPTAWASIQTGKNPGKHGVFDFFERTKGDMKILDSNSIKSKTFYELMEDNGYKCVLINLPLSQPPRTKFPTIGSMFSSNKISPVEITSKYDFSNYRFFYEEKTMLEKFLPDLAVKNIYLNQRENFKVVKDIFINEEWDLFFYLFSSTDWVFHKNGIRFFKEKGASVWINKIFQEIDDYIGWLINNSPKDAIFFIFSDHGFDYYNDLTSFIKKSSVKDLIKISHDFQINTRQSIMKNFLNALIYLLSKNRIMIKLIEHIVPFLVHSNLKICDKKSKILIFWCVYTFLIYINDSRFYGVVKPNETCDLINIFKNIIKSLPLKIVDSKDLYWGAQEKNAPDLIILPYKKFYPIKLFENSFVYTFHYASHKQEGIYIINRKNKKTTKHMRFHVYDIAPTILYLFNIPIPPSLDGHVMDFIF